MMNQRQRNEICSNPRINSILAVYILDEPEAALTPMCLLDMIVEIDRLVQDDSQFIISTHSLILMVFPGVTILEMGDHGIHAVSYRQTEHYECTRRFLENPERMLQMLLADKHIRR